MCDLFKNKNKKYNQYEFHKKKIKSQILWFEMIDKDYIFYFKKEIMELKQGITLNFNNVMINILKIDPLIFSKKRKDQGLEG